MKKIIILAVCLMAAVPCFAQWDIKTFDRIGKNAIIQILGVPESDNKLGGEMDGQITVDYYYSSQFPGTLFVLDEDTNELLACKTKSTALCVLSDLVPGGFKVGDSFEKLQNFDFVHSAYGKNRSGNALNLYDSSSERDYYVAYDLERKFFFFSVKNGVIIGIDMGTLSDDAALYLNCDMTSSPW